MREIKTHIVEGDSANHQLDIQVRDAPGAGGAHHEYLIDSPRANFAGLYISFQNGPILEKGINGVTQEALLAIVIDRLECFQAGPFACFANNVALAACRDALHALQSRTRDRIKRGVEGKSQA